MILLKSEKKNFKLCDTNIFSVGISDEVKGSVIELDEKQQWQLKNEVSRI